MHRDKSDKIYSVIIFILIASIFYQVMYFIYHSWRIQTTSVPTYAPKVYEKKDDDKEDSSNTKETSATVGGFVSKLQDTNLFLYLLQKGLPFQKDRVDYGLLDVVKDITSVDISDPKVLISSQMPILGEYEVDDVEISEEEQREIYNITASKPLNNDEVLEGTTKGEPLVLLYTTHTTESYTSSKKTKIEYISPYRSLNPEHNMTAISKEIKKVLEEEYGIPVILDTTVHDYPNYNASYSNSLKTVKKRLEENPSIKYVFDIHRDGLADSKKNREVYKTVVNEVNSAKVMMVVGMNHENAPKNVSFSEEVYKVVDKMYPTLFRPTIKRSTAKYNQFVSDNAMLFEIGSNLNTLEEAKESARLLGKVLGKVITQREKN